MKGCLTSRPGLFVVLLALGCFGLAAKLEPWFQTWAGNRAHTGNLLQIALGDGRKVFARHVYTKADAYFHNGYYPSIFDEAEGFENAHIDGAAGISEEQEKALDFLGEPRDWIEVFGRQFYPSVHAHLGDEVCGHDHDHEGPCDHDHDHDHEGEGEHSDDEGDGRPTGLEREILPWLRLSVELDPQRVETYAVGAYWLREKLGKSEEAEQFLREGLRVNPEDPTLLFELGRILWQDRHDANRTRNVWEVALANLNLQERDEEDANRFLRARLLGNLGKLEETAGQYDKAIDYLHQLETISPNASYIHQWIEDIQRASAPSKHP